MYLKALILSFLLIGCGYKPTSNYTKNQINDNIFIETKIDINNSEASVFIKDTLTNILINNLNINVVNRKVLANTFIEISIKDVKSKALQTSKDGYSLIYRVTVTIELNYQKRFKNKKTILLKDYATYLIDEDSKITQNNKIEAIKKASIKAIESIVQKISKEEFRR